MANSKESCGESIIRLLNAWRAKEAGMDPSEFPEESAWDVLELDDIAYLRGFYEWYAHEEMHKQFDYLEQMIEITDNLLEIPVLQTVSFPKQRDYIKLYRAGANACVSQKQFVLAEKLYEHSMHYSNALYQRDDRYYKTLMVDTANLAAVYCKQKRYRDAEVLLRNCLNYWESPQYTNSLVCHVLYSKYAEILFGQERYEEAEYLLTQLIDEEKSLIIGASVHTRLVMAQLCFLMAKVLLVQERATEARPFFEQGIETLHCIPDREQKQEEVTIQLVYGLTEYTDFLVDQMEMANALEAVREAFSAGRELAANNPELYAKQFADLAITYGKISGDSEKKTVLEDMTELLKTINVGLKKPYCLRELAEASYELAVIYAREEDHGNAERCFWDAYEILEGLPERGFLFANVAYDFSHLLSHQHTMTATRLAQMLLHRARKIREQDGRYTDEERMAFDRDADAWFHWIHADRPE